MVEAAVLADDDDHVLDRGPGFVSATMVIPVFRKHRAGGELTQRQRAEGEAASLQPT
ncbi:hypothetical protein [Bradyrhizobium sp. USDA 4451]